MLPEGLQENERRGGCQRIQQCRSPRLADNAATVPDQLKGPGIIMRVPICIGLACMDLGKRRKIQVAVRIAVPRAPFRVQQIVTVVPSGMRCLLCSFTVIGHDMQSRSGRRQLGNLVLVRADPPTAAMDDIAPLPFFSKGTAFSVLTAIVCAIRSSPGG